MYQIFEGCYKDGHPEGYGRCIQVDGTIIQGIWVPSDHQDDGDYYLIDGYFLKVLPS
jgi:hypothetical protein